MGSGRGWLAVDWPSTGGVLNITAAAWTAGFHWWRSGNITRTQNVSEYMLVLTLCLVNIAGIKTSYSYAIVDKIFRAVGVKKVSNSKSDLQGHSRSLLLVSFDRPHMISC